jgi:restriction system protein
MPLLNTLVSELWWIAPIFAIGIFIKTPWFKGVLGEWIVRISAKLLLDKKSYRPIHNVTLKTADGTTQIDHVFVSPFGVFVVETKNYGGWIFGGENQAFWTQKLFKKTKKFQNPIRQNYKHTQAISALLNIPNEHIHSLIVFVGGSEFKTEMPPYVTQSGGYIRYIKSKTTVLLSSEEVEHLVSVIQSGRLTPSFTTNREHIQNVQRRLSSDTPRQCPKCGSEMLLRTMKSGDNVGRKFWGCSAFPKCRMIQNVS